MPTLPPGTAAKCIRCGKLLDRADGRAATTCLLFTVSAAMLLVPANLLPLMRASGLGMTQQVSLPSAVAGVWADGWPLLALLFGAFTIVLPLVWSLLMTLVLASAQSSRRPAWLGRAFRYTQALRAWAMPDVVLIAIFVIYMRTSVEFRVDVAWGGWCLIAAVLLIVVTSMSLPVQNVWRTILPDRAAPSGEPAMNCRACNLIAPASARDRPCRRCGARLHPRSPDAVNRTAALVAAGYVLYFPSYYYVMSYSIRPGGVEGHTIIGGITRLMQAGYWYLAVLILFVSVLIPLLKLIGLSWLLVRVRNPSARGLALRTRVYRAIRHLGRWSNTDPFIVALNVPLLSFGGFVGVSAGKAALPFILVTTVTMLATRTFDARLEWDAVGGEA